MTKYYVFIKYMCMSKYTTQSRKKYNFDIYILYNYDFN